MQAKKKILIALLALTAVLAGIMGLWFYYTSDPWGYARTVSAEETALRTQVVSSAESWLGHAEANGTHREIIDLYNSHQPLARGYSVTYEDSWCATFVSAVSILCEMTDRIPTECGCEKQIELFRQMDRWVESDSYIPLPGDIVYYAWDEKFSLGDCTGWSDHVGIVVGTAWPFMKVIEGNYEDAVRYRYILLNHPDIRGFATPDYS